MSLRLLMNCLNINASPVHALSAEIFKRQQRTSCYWIVSKIQLNAPKETSLWPEQMLDTINLI